jgi:hypothetical protein
LNISIVLQIILTFIDYNFLFGTNVVCRHLQIKSVKLLTLACFIFLFPFLIILLFKKLRHYKVLNIKKNNDRAWFRIGRNNFLINSKGTFKMCVVS